MDNNINKKRVTFLLDVKEYEKLSYDAWKNKMSISEYIRRVLLSKDK